MGGPRSARLTMHLREAIYSRSYGYNACFDIDEEKVALRTSIDGMIDVCEILPVTHVDYPVWYQMQMKDYEFRWDEDDVTPKNYEAEGSPGWDGRIDE